VTRAPSDTAHPLPPTLAVVFDLDGTLVDSYDAITECFNHARTTLGEQPLTAARVRTLVGHGLESLMEDAVGRDRVEEAVRLFRERYDLICEESTTLLPGVNEAVTALASRGLSLGVATNKPARFARRILRHLRLAPPLTAILGPSAAIPAKPEPLMLLRVLEELEVPPERALYVGDMTIDVETARNAGVRVWVLPTGSSTRQDLEASCPDRVFSAMSELPGLLAADCRSKGS